ncbi:30S ribosomal protein S17 [candidate division WOR-3 bacterium JGI_Cruoil_03_51_56]|uniref:Small ribosomal subunit protein uS17 n=1 Tax=candidate division WOR-3 bacterium JGI_Cruoil_03_51_56 TaxID=1973747 RepID=A0A235BVQ6_UNCW3|nr:MAG: 30S ribosomal protein S17 [candidate division WOR-3 bacterium JGI_Cruoil_03_51_56]
MDRKRRTVVGTVKSAKMQKTIVVLVERLELHPKYKKYMRRRTKLYAHDERDECEAGDRVLLMETRPLSKLKCWRVVKKL